MFVASYQLSVIERVCSVNISLNASCIESHYTVFICKRMQPESRNEVILQQKCTLSNLKGGEGENEAI